MQQRGGGMDVEFSSLLCKSQGMVTINILYSLKSSKNTVLERGVGGCVHFLTTPPRCIQLGCVLPAAAHIYIFINTGVYNEPGMCQEQHFCWCRPCMSRKGNKRAKATFVGTSAPTLHTF